MPCSSENNIIRTLPHLVMIFVLYFDENVNYVILITFFKHKIISHSIRNVVNGHT